MSPDQEWGSDGWRGSLGWTSQAQDRAGRRGYRQRGARGEPRGPRASLLVLTLPGRVASRVGLGGGGPPLPGGGDPEPVPGRKRRNRSLGPPTARLLTRGLAARTGCMKRSREWGASKQSTRGTPLPPSPQGQEDCMRGERATGCKPPAESACAAPGPAWAAVRARQGAHQAAAAPSSPRAAPAGRP